MILDTHWWRTANPPRLVPDGDPAADTLAYPAGTEIPDELAIRLGMMPAPDVDQEPVDQADADLGPDGAQAGPEEPAGGPDDPTKLAAKPADKSLKLPPPNK